MNVFTVVHLLLTVYQRSTWRWKDVPSGGGHHGAIYSTVICCLLEGNDPPEVGEADTG